MITTSKTAKLAAGAVGFVMAISAFMPVLASADTASDLQAQINSLLATISALQAQLSATTGGSTVSSGYTFNTNLTIGSKGADVMNLQKVLNMSADTQVASSGAGSPGMETSTFGPLTRSAVAKFQTKNGISPAAGYVGPITRAKLNSMGGGVTSVPTVPGTNPQGGALSVMAGSQPVNSLAPATAARVPFTRFVVTAGASDVTVNSVTVQRVGLADNAAFAGVVLLKSDGTQIGVSRTINSNDQAVVGEPFVVKAGTSQTLTVAGNMTTAALMAAHTGQVAGLNVVAVNTSASVSGSLPISGASHTLNSNLSLGASTPSRGSLDPNTTANKEIGTTNYTFSSVKVDAGSGEDLRLWSIRWNQSGSASASDLANVKVYVDGTAYDTMVSSDGKYYSASFPGGILIAEGLSKEVSIKGDIVSGTNRQVSFDLYKSTDLYLTGETYGYGITPASTGTGFNTTTPWYNASNVTITAGVANTISQSNTVAAQNIAVLVADQPLGGFEVKLSGEPMTVQQMVFNITAVGDTVAHITNIKLVNQNGVVLAGPEDGSGAAQSGTVTFGDSVTFPVGTTVLKLVGRLSSDFISGDSVQASTTPSSQWSTPTGESTGDTVDLSTFSSSVQGNLMTVRAGALAISVSTQPTARSVIAGAQGFEFARYTLDAGQSGEDVRLSTFKPLLALTTVTASMLSSCGLYDGTTNLTDATNVTVALGDNTFTFNSGGFVVPKGTSKTISLKCNVSASATSGNITWGLTDLSSAYTGATGVTSGLTIVETMTAAAGQIMTASTGGSYTVTNDSALLYKVAQAGSTGSELARFRFTAGASEAVNLKQIALVLGNTASNSPADLVGQKVYLYNGATMIGSAQFGGASPDHATSTLLSPAPMIAAGESVLITVKGDLSAQNINEGTPGAFLTVNYNGDNNGLNGNYATGNDSQVTVSGGTTGAVSSNGQRIFRTVPTIAVTSNGGTLAAGGDLYKFTVTNPNNRDVVFQKFTFSIATSGGSTNGFVLYGDGIAFNNSTSTVASETFIELVGTGTSNAQIVPANSTKTFILKATTAVDTASVSETIGLALLADTSFGSQQYLMGTVTSVEAGSAATDNIIWSPFSTTTPVATAASQLQLDWVNGYGLPGFPSNTDFPVQTWTRAN
ncbi:MAG: peptidoglycan-binding protein [Minisyncoccia bacterium]